VDDLAQPRRNVAERFGQRRRILIRVDEDERPPGVDRDRPEPERVEVEAGLAVGARRGPEGTVEPIGPRVVRALQRLAAALTACQDMPAVAADVQEGAELPVA